MGQCGKESEKLKFFLRVESLTSNNTQGYHGRKLTVEPRWAKQQTKKLQPTKINSLMSGPSLSLTPDPKACN